LIVNHERLEEFDIHLYNLLYKFSKKSCWDKNILNRLGEYEEISRDISFLDRTPSEGDDLKSIKRKNLSATFSMQKGSGRFTPRLRSKWLEF